MKNFKLVIILTYMLAAACTNQNGKNAQWRGTNRDGIYQDKNLLKAWPKGGPKLLWFSEEIGNGYASPAIAGDRLFINGEIEGNSQVFAFDLKGKLVWKSPNGPEFSGKDFSASFPGARSTPTVYGNLVFACSGMGRIACFDALSGAEKWSVNMVGDLGGIVNMFGCSESLLVDDKNVYCFPGGKENNIVALDKNTGKMVWTSKALGDAVSFCSPMVISLPERKILVTLSHEYLMGLDIHTGELLWSQKEDSVKMEGEYCNTPVYSDGFIYEVSGVEKGSGAFKLQLSPDGKSIKEVWRNLKVKNAIGGFVKSGDRIFCATDDKKLKSIDIKSGSVLDSLSNLRGSVIFADDHLYCYTDNGHVNLINISGPKLEVVSQFKIEKGTKEHFSHPVISNGVLYIRHGNTLMAYGLK